MATQEQIDELKRKLAEAEAAVSTTPLNQQVSQLDAERARITRALSAGNRARILLNSTTLTTPLTPERRVDLERDLAAVPALEQQLASVQSELDTVVTEQSQLFNQRNALREQLATAEKAFKDATPPPASVDSAGAIQSNADTARDDGATSQLPAAGQQVIDQEGRVGPEAAAVAPSNAVPYQTNDDSPPPIVKTTNNTQAPTGSTEPPGPADAQPQANIASGAAAPTEESQGPLNATQSAINSRFPDKIIPQPNALDNFGSYTYSISIYLMGPKQYSDLIASGKKTLDGMDLIIQSAGAPVTGRNQEFLLDYYIDDLEIKQLPGGKGTRGAHNSSELSFKLTEPNGITLFKTLNRAIQQYNKKIGNTAPINYTAQNYLMVIRFYGYDASGNLVNTYRPVDTTDQAAVVEKFIPFQFKSITFTIANRLVEYQCQATAIQSNFPLSQTRGIIPFNIQLTATTVDQLLRGNASYSTLPGPGGLVDPQQQQAAANTAPKPELITGLVDAINRFQQKLVQEKKQEFADVYKIVFTDPDSAIQKAKLRPPGQTDLASTASAPPRTAGDKANPKKQSVNNDVMNKSVTAGTSIVQFINMVIRNSTYIYDQVKQTKDKNGNFIPVAASAKDPAWFKISLQAVPIEGKYDRIRNTWAYEITYGISYYRPATIVSEYFPEGRFIGTHKKYDYWFTGLNSSIIKYEQAFNYQYYLTVTAPSTVNPTTTTDYREVYRRYYAPTTSESEQGVKNSGIAGASAADYLYSPGDTSTVNLEIIGDPAYMMQGEIWAGVAGQSFLDPAQVSFLSDGTINYDSQAVLFEVAFNTPADYDLDTGLMNIKDFR
jgi:hypothetical protein